MAVTSTDAFSGPYFPNGVTTAFPFDFKVVHPTEVSVLRYLAGAFTEVSSALYSVTIAGDGEGGTVTYSAAPTDVGGTLFIVSDPFFDSAFAASNSGFMPVSLNPAFDRSAVRDIWLRDRVGRALQFPFGETGSLLPNATDRAFKLLQFDYLGRGTVVSPTDLGFDLNGDFDGGVDDADDGAIYLGGADG